MSSFSNKKIKEITRLTLIISDVAAILVPAFFIYTLLDTIDGHAQFRIRSFVGVLSFLVSMLFCSQTLYEQYSIRRSFYDEFRELLQIYLFNGLGVLSALFIFSLSTERGKHILFLAVVFISIPIFRVFSRILLDRLGVWKMQCLVLCPRSEFKFAKAAIESQFNLGMHVNRSSYENRLLINIIRNAQNYNISDYASVKAEIKRYHEEIGYPHIVVFSHLKNTAYLPKIVELIIHCGLPYSIIPDIGGASLVGMRLSHFFRWELLLVTPQNNIQRASFQLLKRGIDVIFSVAFMVLFFFPMLIIYLLVKSDRGPGFFLHERLGRNGKLFNCIKFRSMRQNSDVILSEFLRDNADAQREWELKHKLVYDPRFTRFGRHLRRMSLDELPQLLNVLLGDMSLVGPRPIVPQEVDKYGSNIEFYSQVRPGMTGLWQISGRSSTTYEYRVSLDVWYIKNWSFWYDIGILLKTIGVVLSRRGSS